LYIFEAQNKKNMATKSLESFSYSLRPRVTLYFKNALFSIQRCINQFFMKIKKLRKNIFCLLMYLFVRFITFKNSVFSNYKIGILF